MNRDANPISSITSNPTNSYSLSSSTPPPSFSISPLPIPNPIVNFSSLPNILKTAFLFFDSFVLKTRKIDLMKN